MGIVAVMATYPARDGSVGDAVASLAGQVDRVHLVLNEYVTVPAPGRFPANVFATIPERDLKDTGKFSIPVAPDDLCLLCDDDILYPPDYAARMAEALEAHAARDAVVGVHGVIYSDFFDGAPEARLVHSFDRALEHGVPVNQLGTGTLACSGRQMPPFSLMESAARFVDVRFAAHCAAAGRPMICIAREAGWLRQIETGPSLFETFTAAWPAEVVREAARIGGFRRLALAGEH